MCLREGEIFRTLLQTVRLKANERELGFLKQDPADWITDYSQELNPFLPYPV